ncbi:MAG: nucleotidyl transferase AbiEii/AbiGii toxin family protein [Planctomycetota bacterium]
MADIPGWNRENRTTTLEANIRFMEYVVLNCIGSDPTTERGLVLKGGNALRFAFQSPRSTKDLDFTVTGEEILDDADRLRDLLNRVLRFAERRFRVKAKCQRVERRPPPAPHSTRPTYSISIAYQFESDRYFHNFDDCRHLSTVIPLEIRFNDLVCETCRWAGDASLRVCSLEDILAEKLRSLLQQKIRKRNRCQDVYDIAQYVRQRAIDAQKIGSYLQQKASIRDIEVRKSSFDDVIREMASDGYDEGIHQQAPHDFIPFDDAWESVMSLVESLDIPN